MTNDPTTGALWAFFGCIGVLVALMLVSGVAMMVIYQLLTLR